MLRFEVRTSTFLRPAAALLALLALMGSLPWGAARGACPVRSVWPTGDWPSVASQVAAQRPAEIAALESYAFTLTGTDAERLGLRTDGLLIIKGGQIVYERYARGWDGEKPHLAWSVAKSATSALTGVAVQQGAVALDDRIDRHVPVSNEDPRAAGITIRQLLELSSGFQWTESYEGASYQASSVLAMLYGVGRKDVVRFITSHPLRDAPGTSWDYSTGDTTLLSSVIAAAMRPRFGEDWAHDTLFTPTGMRSAVLQLDPRGNPYGGSYFFVTARDLAKLGYLYLGDGCWDGQRLLPEGWVTSSMVVAPTFRSKPINPSTEPNGWQWWLNQAVPEQGIATRPWPDVPGDAYAAEGHWGQMLVVVPSQDLLVVRFADDRNAHVDLNRLVSLSMEVAR